VSYADFITLLFAFFVVMFAASNSDQKKAGQVSKAVQGAFHDLAFFSPSGKVVPLFDDGGVPSTETSIVGNLKSGFSATQVVPSGGNGLKVADRYNQAKTELKEAFSEEEKTGTVRFTEDGRGLVLSLAEAGFFDPGSAIMRPKALDILDRIAQRVSAAEVPLRVEGHTDNTPIHTAQFPSNWELSTARATNVLQYLIANAHLDPQRLSAIGYGEYKPVADNSTVEGRAANRRVDLVILGAAAQKLEP
jgi:chemotaxis protein MotB